jgi:hypothetical protein
MFYFEPFGLNESLFGVTTEIQKSYPDQPHPSSLDTALVDPSELTSDGFLKYFEYELTIGNLLSSQCYWIRVTRTDYGAPQFGLPGDESALYEFDLEGCPEVGPPSFDYSQGWNLVSAPVDLDSPLPLDVFGDDLPFWQLYGWDGFGYYAPSEVTGCSEGYWLLVPEPARVDYLGSDCAPISTSYCFNPELGWNLVGSPFPDYAFLPDAEFSLDGGIARPYQVAVYAGWIGGDLYAWNGSDYVPGYTVEAGEACWLAVLVDGLEICWYPQTMTPRAVRRTDPLATSEHPTVTIGLRGGRHKVQLGLSDEATSGFDSRFDRPSPPPAPGVSADLTIIAKGDPVWNRLQTDLRLFEDEIEW